VERYEIGNFFLIRESHAHTWVEVFDPKLGWTRFDPTPADPSLFEPLSTWDRIRQIFESAQLQWVNWIVDYSIHQQRQGVQNVNQKTQTVRHNTRMQWFTLRQEFRKFFSDTSLMQNILAVFFAFLALTFLLYWLIRGLRSGRRRKKEEPIIFYEKTLHLLARKGISRCPEWTPHEFQAFAQERLADPMARKSFEEITELFCEIRYGQRPQNLALEKRTHQLLRDLRQGLRG
jgi:hypothetical protein